MANGNHEPEKPRRKKCPILNDWCINQACALSVELNRPVGGNLVQKGHLCAFSAMVIMLSEINAKTQGQQQQQQKIILPHLKGK